MSQLIEVKVPDIGDFKDVPVIEVSVKVGDTVKIDDPLLTLESDKATMEVPSSAAGVAASPDAAPVPEAVTAPGFTACAPRSASFS